MRTLRRFAHRLDPAVEFTEPASCMPGMTPANDAGS
jgi:hypothetical protein